MERLKLNTQYISKFFFNDINTTFLHKHASTYWCGYSICTAAICTIYYLLSIMRQLSDHLKAILPEKLVWELGKKNICDSLSLYFNKILALLNNIVYSSAYSKVTSN